MILPVQIAYRNMKPPEAVDTRIREEVTKLETFYNRIMHCRVIVGIPHRHHRKGDLYHVLIDMAVPGAELVVKREPSFHNALRHINSEKESKRFEAQAAHKDVFVVIHDAFKEARRQLQDFARRERGETKLHLPPSRARVSRLFPDDGYGFLKTVEGNEIYFHKNSVLNDAFSRLTLGSSVIFTEERGEKGVQASTVRHVG
ncbi:MAG: HPF/RaiA family ribosome-associated protein [Pyrinomonadaceae bacterium]